MAEPVEPGPVIQVELRLEGSMPSGIVTGPDGAVRDFAGWVALMSAVDALSAVHGGEGVGGQ